MTEDKLKALNKSLRMYPELKPFYQSIQLYRSSIEDKDYSSFLKWLKPQLADKSSPFHYYAKHLRSDIIAIENSFNYPYTNGLLEGQINRLKTIKRVIYGRASIKLLEKRVLYRL